MELPLVEFFEVKLSSLRKRVRSMGPNDLGKKDICHVVRIRMTNADSEPTDVFCRHLAFIVSQA